MSNPVTESFGFQCENLGFGFATNVPVPSGTIYTAFRIPLFAEYSGSNKMYGRSSISDLAVVLDAVVPTGSTLRCNLHNATSNSYFIDEDMSAGSAYIESNSTLSVSAGDQVYLILADILGSGFLVSRLQWKAN